MSGSRSKGYRAMAEYIERVALTSSIDAERERNKQKANDQLDLYGNLYSIGYTNGLAIAATMIITAPAADVEPVKRGHWVQYYRQERFWYSCDDVEIGRVPSGFTCSECGRYESKKEPYCHCGAKMDLEESSAR